MIDGFTLINALMADGHAKISSAKTKINNRELAKTLADLVDDDRNNSMSDVESVEMDANKKENTQRKAMATSNSSDNTSTLGSTLGEKQIKTIK